MHEAPKSVCNLTAMCALRSVKVLQFYEVVPVPMLLDVLAGDVPSVAQRVQRLVLPFYFSGHTS
jgi:hypothetical protein